MTGSVCFSEGISGQPLYANDDCVPDSWIGVGCVGAG